MKIPKEPGDYLLQDEWGPYTKATKFPSGKMAYREWHWDEEEALEDETKLYCGCVPLGMYVLPNARWSVVKKVS